MNVSEVLSEVYYSCLIIDVIHSILGPDKHKSI